MPDANPQETKSASLSLRASLWTAQSLLALTFAGGALWKVLTPLSDIAKMMPWTGEVAPSFFYMTAAFDFLGGVGVILPSLTRILPKVTVLAALGCVALMLCAIVFHFSRGEAANTPFNFALVGLSLFVAWGRNKKAPILPRSPISPR